MKTEDYHKIIFEGYADNRTYFNAHLNRESIKALENETISKQEFFERCSQLIEEAIASSIEDYNRLNKELKDRIEENYSPESVAYATKRLNEERENITFFYDKSNPFDEGPAKILSLEELKIIQKEIICLMTKTSSPTSSTDSIITTEPLNLHNHIFLNEYFILFERLFLEFDIKNNSRKDIKFIYTKMEEDTFIHETVKFNYFLNWVNQQYNLSIEPATRFKKTPPQNKLYNNVAANFKDENID